MAQGTILIIEDEQDVLDVLCEMVTLFGYTVARASDGILAWEMIRRANYDLVITDLGLPGMDGVELVKSMRANSLNVPVLVIAGIDFDKSDLEIKRASNCDFIQKPFKMKDIKEKISQLLKGKEQASQKTKHDQKTTGK